MSRPPGKFEDLTGKKFNRLTVIRLNRVDARNRRYWDCTCECGNTKTVRGDMLKAKNKGVTSCGCIQKEAVAESNHERGTHHLSSNRLFRIWKGMIFRCNNPKSTHYHNYGGRGITVCDKWRNSVDSFIEWANRNGYEDYLTIERKDVNGNYCPENCEWITPKEQNFNKTNTVLVEINGVSKTIPEWAEETGINKFTLRKRFRNGDRGSNLIRPIDKTKSTR
ncbi:hypothetical protein ABFV99_13370 [Cytobacillus horneckiae]|uniref:hypothetical protein n=1 Tax=Cytobacillus horneckiae TaxID=549687 RepID=UPI0034CD3A43